MLRAPLDRSLLTGWGAILGAAVAAGLLGVFAPGYLWLALVLPIAGLALLLGPPWWYLSGVIVAAVATSLVRVQAPSTVGLLGHGRTAALLAGLALLHVVLRRADFRIPRPTALAAGLYTASVLLAALVGLARGADAGTTLADVQREVSQTLPPLFLALVALSSEALRARAFRAFGIAALGIALLVMLYWAWNSAVLVPTSAGLESLFANARGAVHERGLSPDRIAFPLIDTDPNSSAAILVVIAAIGVAPLLATTRLLDRLLGLLVLVALSAAVLMTQSRMGIVLLLVLGVGYATFSPLSVGQRAAVAAAALTGGVAILVTALSWFPEDRRITAQDYNVQSRLAIYQDALDDATTAPLLGHGLRYGAQPRYYTGLSTHNEYLQRLVDGGIVGAVAFLVVLGTFFTMALLTRTNRPFEAAIRTGTLTALTVLLVSMSAVASWTAVPFLQIVSWLTFGIISATYARPAAGTRQASSPDRDTVSRSGLRAPERHAFAARAPRK